MQSGTAGHNWIRVHIGQQLRAARGNGDSVCNAAHTDARAQEEEVRAIQWLPFENAVEALTFDSTREILRQADAFLDGGER